jgi:hypothetical protein
VGLRTNYYCIATPISSARNACKLDSRLRGNDEEAVDCNAIFNDCNGKGNKPSPLQTHAIEKM